MGDAKNLPHQRRVDGCYRVAQVDVIESIKHFPADFSVRLLAEIELLGQGPVGGAKTRPSENVSPGVAQLILSRNAESAPVEPQVARRIGNLSAGVAVRRERTAVRIQNGETIGNDWSKWRARHPPGNARELPSPHDMPNRTLVQEFLLGTEGQFPDMADREDQRPVDVGGSPVPVVIERSKGVVCPKVVGLSP